MGRQAKPDPRRCLVEALRRWEREKIFAAELLEDIRRRTDFSRADRRLVTTTLNGVIRRRLTLDWLICRFSSRRPPPRTGAARQILRISLFHLLYLDNIPPHAVLHQAGELAGKLVTPGEKSYINGLLRSVQRAGKDLPFPPREDRAAYLSAAHSHPRWLVERWGRDRGWDETEKICRVNNLAPPIFARCNRLKSQPAELESALAGEGVDWSPVPGPGGMYRIAAASDLMGLESFRGGRFLVQDLSTLRAVELLEPVPGERIADFCAAPGGKTALIAEKMNNTGRILAADSSQARLVKLRETVSRCGIANAVVRRVDLLENPPGRGGGRWDGILLDVPCSNTGVLRRRVDARWRIGYDDILRLAGRGADLLAAAGGRVRPGGRIVYSTCSLEPEENGEVVRRFLQARTDYALEAEESGIPREDGGDGYYAARLRRTDRPRPATGTER